MNRQEALIGRALKGAHLGSYGALAKRMGVSAATMSQWRSGTSKLSDERVTQLSELAGDDPGIWLIAMMAEECNITPLRKSLQDIVSKVGKGMSMAIALGVASLPWAGSAKAHDFKGLSESARAHSVYYVQSVPGGAGVPFASITALLCQAKKPASPACPSRLGSYGFLHRPIRVCGSIQSLIGNESQRSQ
ncbi:hypothetical protein AAGG42_11730 [Stenotrophomonas maltophilia]|uniref:hypothetical protein n=1 Tax=Stenotrophomonas maltophilia TaxID=40324 RepID=UPI00314531A5